MMSGNLSESGSVAASGGADSPRLPPARISAGDGLADRCPASSAPRALAVLPAIRRAVVGVRGGLQAAIPWAGAALVAVGHVAGTVFPHPFSAGVPAWREGVQCGPNALYMLLRLSGWEGDLAQVRNLVPVDRTHGCSLLDLQKAGSKLGAPVTSIATDLKGLVSLDRPCIVHLDKTQRTSGHFVLFLGVGKDRLQRQPAVYLYDPILMSEYDLPLGEFERYWSSYALIVDRLDPVRTHEIIIQSALAGSSLLLAASAGTIAASMWISGRRLREGA